MSHSDHPIAGFAFLAVAFGTIAWGAEYGISTSKRALAEGAKKEVNAEVRKAVDVGRGGDFEQAQKMLEEIVAKHPNDPDALFNLGISQTATERDDEADKTFQRVLELAPEDWDAVAERASIKKRKGQVDEALAMLEKIPAGKGHLHERLTQDPLWADISDGRMEELKKRHGIDGKLDTTVRDVEPE